MRWATSPRKLNSRSQPGSQQPLVVAVDDGGRAVVVGHYTSAIDFGSALITAAGVDAFVASFAR